MITSSVTAIRTHAEAEGRADYLGRADDVDHGSEDPSWAWPWSGADEAYINAVGPSSILAAIGVPGLSWEDACDEWCVAFRRGYEGAHAQAVRS